jgi:hypothetical protein
MANEEDILWQDVFQVGGHTVGVTTGKDGNGGYVSEVAIDDDDDAMARNTDNLDDAKDAHREGIRIVKEMQAQFGL